MVQVNKVCSWCERLRPLAQFVLGLFALTLSLYGIYTIFLWYSDINPVMQYLGGDITPKVARPDEFMIAYLDIKKLRDCPGTVQRRLTGECGEHKLSATPSYLAAGFSGRITLPFQVPQHAIPGACAFQAHSWFVCNPFDLWNKRHYVSAPIPFKVLRYDE